MAAEQNIAEPQPAYMLRKSCAGLWCLDTMEAQAALLPRLWAWHWILRVSIGYRASICVISPTAPHRASTARELTHLKDQNMV